MLDLMDGLRSSLSKLRHMVKYASVHKKWKQGVQGWKYRGIEEEERV